MNIASIDIGTNTVLLLISSIDPKTKTLTDIMEKHSYPRIGEDLSSSGIINESKILLLLKILNEYKIIAEAFNCSKIVCAATYGFRNAKNRFDIVKRVQKTIGLNIKILSGEEEAILSLYGVGGFDYKNKDFQVIDIGGGSTEIVLSKKGKIISNTSLNIGVVTLKEQSKSLEKLESELNKFLEHEFNRLKFTKDNLPTFGLAGTPITLAKMLQADTPIDQQIINGYSLNITQVQQMLEIFRCLTPKKILEKYGQIAENREDLILYGTIILFNIMKLLNLDNVIVCTKGLRHGLIINELL